MDFIQAVLVVAGWLMVVTATALTIISGLVALWHMALRNRPCKPAVRAKPSDRGGDYCDRDYFPGNDAKPVPATIVNLRYPQMNG